MGTNIKLTESQIDRLMKQLVSEDSQDNKTKIKTDEKKSIRNNGRRKK
jgi:hypothetical protein